MKNSRIVPMVIIFISIISTVYLYNLQSTVEDNILEAEETKKILEQRLKTCISIDEHFGRVSDKFYANKPIIVIDETENVTVYNTAGNQLVVSSYFPNTEVEWGNYENGIADCKIIPKSSGYASIKFTDNVTQDNFYVLAIVK